MGTGFLKKIFIRASRIPAFNIGLLFFLAALSFLKSVALTFTDISAVQLYLTQSSRLGFGFDLIITAVLLSFVGYQTRSLYRYQGYGGFILVSFLTALFTGLILGIEAQLTGIFDAFFIVKFAYFYLINACFWSVASRFVPLRANSLKIVFLMFFEALGYVFGGFFDYFVPVGAYGLLYYAMALYMVFYAGLYVLVQMMPVTIEKFSIQKAKAQDFAERKLVQTLLCFSFFTLTAFCLANYIFYTHLAAFFDGFGILKQMGLWWGALGLLEFLLALLFIRPRHFYLLSGSMFILSAGLGAFGIALFYNSYFVLFCAFLSVCLPFYLCYSGYVLMLLKPLGRGGGIKSINRKRILLIEPAGFMLGGVIVSHFPPVAHQAMIMASMGILLAVMLLCITRFYTNVVLKLLKLREWPHTRLMLSSKRVFNYIREEMRTAGTDEYIYFLNILENAPEHEYYKSVIKSLKHPSETVRLAALERICRSRQFLRYQSAVQFVFNKDKSSIARAQALAVLIQIAHLKDDLPALTAYQAYLDDRRLKTGAMIGFLSIGDNYALLAMDGLQKLANGRMVSDKLAALQVMRQVPSIGLVRVLMPLLQSTDPLIANEALRVAGLMRHPESLPIILESIDDVDLQENALFALKGFGVGAYPAIERSLNNDTVSLMRKRILIFFLAQCPDNESRQILLRVLKRGSRALRNTLIRTMTDSGIYWQGGDKYKFLQEHIYQDVERIGFFNNFIEKYKQAPVPEAQDAFLFLTRAMGEDVAETRMVVFHQLLLLKNMPIFQKAVRVLLSDDLESYPPALGVIQDVLPRRLYQTVEQVAKQPFQRKKEVILPTVEKKEALQDVADLILSNKVPLSPWITASALYCLQKLNDKEALAAVHACLKSKDLLVIETAVQALKKLLNDEAEVRRYLLDVSPTQLIKLPLDKLL